MVDTDRTRTVCFTNTQPAGRQQQSRPTDLAWLGAIAGKVSDRLLALDATAVAEHARAMREALRRYVPGAVAPRASPAARTWRPASAK